MNNRQYVGSSQPVTGMAVSTPMSILIPPHIDWCQAAGLSPATVEARRRVLQAADAALPWGIDTATTEELATWLVGPKPPNHWRPWTRVTYYGHLDGFYTWATTGEDCELDYNPAAGLRRPAGGEHAPNPVTTYELETALARSNWWWQRVIMLAAYAGLRRGDIVTLTRGDVSADWIRIRDGKGNKSARIPTHPHIWSQVRDSPAGRLVLSPTLHRPVPPGRLSMMARAHFDAIGMPDVHLHRFRHWFATMLLETGTDLLTASKLMRHASPAQMASYALVSKQRLDAGINALPRFGPVRSRLVGRQSSTVSVQRITA
jgi:integrase/recombinase XerD